MIAVNQTFRYFSHCFYNIFDKPYTLILSHPYTSLFVGVIFCLGLSYKYRNSSLSYERGTQLNDKNLDQKNMDSLLPQNQSNNNSSTDFAGVLAPPESKQIHPRWETPKNLLSISKKNKLKKYFWNTKRTFEVKDPENKVDLSKYFTTYRHQNDPIMLDIGFKSGGLDLIACSSVQYTGIPMSEAINKIRLLTKKYWEEGRRCLVIDQIRFSYNIPNEVIKYRSYEECLEFFMAFPTFPMLRARFMSLPPRHFDPCFLSLCHRSAINCFSLEGIRMPGENNTKATFLDAKIHQQSIPKAPGCSIYWDWVFNENSFCKEFDFSKESDFLRTPTPKEIERLAKIILLDGKSFFARNSENYKSKLKRTILITNCIKKDSYFLVSGWIRKNHSLVLLKDKIIHSIVKHLPTPYNEVERIQALYKSPIICESRLRQYVPLLASLITANINLFAAEVDQFIREIKRIIDIIIENKIALIETKIKSNELREKKNCTDRESRSVYLSSGKNLNTLLVYLFYRKAELQDNCQPYNSKIERNKLFLEFRKEIIGNRGANLVNGWGGKNISILLPNDIISLIAKYLPTSCIANKNFLKFKEEFIDNKEFHTEADYINLLNRMLHFVGLGSLQLDYSGRIVGERGRYVFIPFEKQGVHELPIRRWAI
ncbi:MAG: hypothetical protein AAF443_05440 [Chlamydiota bacterium]